MANRSKSKKSQSSGPASLKTEKDTKLTVSQVIRDERTHKIIGAAFLLISIFLFISFTSYLFTWREDQDKVFRGIYPCSVSRYKWPTCSEIWVLYCPFVFYKDLAGELFSMLIFS
jgi:hypothetical protein